MQSSKLNDLLLHCFFEEMTDGLEIIGMVSPFRAVGTIDDHQHLHLSKTADSAQQPLPVTLLAEPFPGTMAQGVVLVFL